MGNVGLGLAALRGVATLVPLPDHCPETRKDRRRPPDLLHLAAQIIRDDVDRQSRHLAPKRAARTGVHAHPVQLCLAHHRPLPNMVLVQVGQCGFSPVRVQLERLERRKLLHGRLWQEVPEGTGADEARRRQVAKQSRCHAQSSQWTRGRGCVERRRRRQGRRRE